MQQKKIECKIYGSENSTHYLEPITLEIKNLTNNFLSISINNGDMFIPDDSTKQNIVVTNNELISLQPKGMQKTRIKGMCTEQEDGSGNATTIYTFEPNKNENLKKIAVFISKNKLQTSAAQFAVWCITNPNNDLNNIIAADSSEENKLKRFTADLTGKSYELILSKYNYKTHYYAPPKEKVGGMFEYNFSTKKDIQIAMFNSDGILVRELFNQKMMQPGNHKINFEYDSSIYTDDVYYFKLIADNEVLVNRAWNAKKIRDAFKNKIENGN